MQVALAQAREGRLHILGKMREAIDGSRQELSDFAPRMLSIKINPEKIRDVIGKGGATIRALTEETGCQIDISDDGSITIASADLDRAHEAERRIKELTADVEVGQEYQGTVQRLLDFGAIVQVLPGRDGLLHISEIANYRIADINDVLKVGQTLRVKILEADERGRLRLSVKAIGGIEAQGGPSAPAAQ
jgi:polyribonucleotide nucleotidyltransferase